MFGRWKRNEELNQMNLSLVKALERKNNYIATLESSLRSKKEECDALCNQVTIKDNRLIEMTKDLTKAINSLKDVDSLRSHYDEISEKLEIAEKHIRLVEEQTIPSLQAAVQYRDDRISKLENEIKELKEEVSYRAMNERSMLNNEEIYKKEIADLKEQVKLLEGLKDTLYKQEKDNQYLAKIIRSMLVDFNKIRELADDACEDCPTITEYKE